MRNIDGVLDTGVSLHWDQYQNISGYKIILETGSVVVDTIETGITNGYFYYNISGYNSITFSVMSYQWDSTLLNSSNTIISFADPTISSAGAYVYEDYTVITIVSDMNPIYLSLYSGGTTQQRYNNIFSYTGGSLTINDVVSEGTAVRIVDASGRVSSGTELSFSLKSFGS